MVAFAAACGDCVVRVAASAVAATQIVSDASSRDVIFMLTDPPDVDLGVAHNARCWEMVPRHDGASAVPRALTRERSVPDVANPICSRQLGAIECNRA